MSITAGVANKILNTKAVTYLTKPNAPAAAATIALISNLTKDAVNCYYYVAQSLNNERIPEEKRKFVAGLDLANGILNVLVQTIVGVTLPVLTNKVFEKNIVPKFFSKDAISKMYTKLKPNVPLAGFEDKMLKNKAFAKIGLSVIATLVGTQIIAKRIIVPLIATPLASYFKDKFKNNKKCECSDYDGDKISFENNIKNDNHSKIENIPKCFEAFMR